MGILSGVLKPFKKVFKKIGKRIKSVFKKIGKFMNKIGPLGTIAMSIMLPGIGEFFSGMFSKLTQGYLKLSGSMLASSNPLISGMGNIMTKAASFGKAVSGTVTNVTGAVSDFINESVRFIGKSVGLDKVGPTKMKEWFAKGASNFAGKGGFLEKVSQIPGDRWTKLTTNWTNFGTEMVTSTAKYQAELASGTFGSRFGQHQTAIGLDKHRKTYRGVEGASPYAKETTTGKWLGGSPQDEVAFNTKWEAEQYSENYDNERLGIYEPPVEDPTKNLLEYTDKTSTATGYDPNRMTVGGGETYDIVSDPAAAGTGTGTDTGTDLTDTGDKVGFRDKAEKWWTDFKGEYTPQALGKRTMEGMAQIPSSVVNQAIQNQIFGESEYEYPETPTIVDRTSGFSTPITDAAELPANVAMMQTIGLGRDFDWQMSGANFAPPGQGIFANTVRALRPASTGMGQFVG